MSRRVQQAAGSVDEELPVTTAQRGVDATVTELGRVLAEFAELAGEGLDQLRTMTSPDALQAQLAAVDARANQRVSDAQTQLATEHDQRLRAEDNAHVADAAAQDMQDKLEAAQAQQAETAGQLEQATRQITELTGQVEAALAAKQTAEAALTAAEQGQAQEAARAEAATVARDQALEQAAVDRDRAARAEAARTAAEEQAAVALAAQHQAEAAATEAAGRATTEAARADAAEQLADSTARIAAAQQARADAAETRERELRAQLTQLTTAFDGVASATAAAERDAAALLTETRRNADQEITRLRQELERCQAAGGTAGPGGKQRRRPGRPSDREQAPRSDQDDSGSNAR